MGGLRRICKLYGGIVIQNNKRKIVRWLWDYVNDEPRLESEMTKEEIAASEKAKLEGIKEGIKKIINKNKNENNNF